MVVDYLIKNDTRLMISQVEAEDGFIVELEERLKVKPTSLMLVPILIKDIAVGGILILNEAPSFFTDSDLRLLTAFCSWAAIALENAQLYRRVDEQINIIEEAQRKAIQTERLATLGLMVATVAHEVNNPLQAVQGFLTLIENDLPASSEAFEYLKLAQSEVEQASQIIVNMRDLYRPAVEKYQPVEVAAQVKDVLILARGRLRRHGINVNLKIASNLPPILGIAQQLKQVFINIIFNAIEAMPPGGDLQIIIARRHEQVSLTFIDTGVGISEAQLARLFNPFFSTKEEGTGLGLAICRSLIRDHGGSINVQSVEGQGTTFEILLPAYTI
jgi:signal transduction histidine kinase